MDDGTTYTTCASPVGELLLTSDGATLTGVSMEPHPEPARLARRRDDGKPFDEARRQLRAYFAGESMAFDLPLRARGTKFQQRVWQVLREIPYGETVSYGEIARRAGQPGAARAVGAAIGRNPIPIVIPCHRVIGADGSLTGYGGGLARKKALLELEGGALAQRVPAIAG